MSFDRRSPIVESFLFEAFETSKRLNFERCCEVELLLLRVIPLGNGSRSKCQRW